MTQALYAHMNSKKKKKRIKKNGNLIQSTLDCHNHPQPSIQQKVIGTD
jgi:hypothetical protein